MGKLNIFTLLVAIVLQFVVGYLWYGSYLFGDVVSAGGHAINFLKLDVVSLLLIVLSSYGLLHLMDMIINLLHVKDVGDVLKHGVMIGSLGIGLPIVMLLNLMGIDKVVLLVIFTHLVLITSLIGVVVLKLKKV